MALKFPDGVIHCALDGKQRFDQAHQVQCAALHAPGPPVPRLASLLFSGAVVDIQLIGRRPDKAGAIDLGGRDEVRRRTEVVARTCGNDLEITAGVVDGPLRGRT